MFTRRGFFSTLAAAAMSAVARLYPTPPLPAGSEDVWQAVLFDASPARDALREIERSEMTAMEYLLRSRDAAWREVRP